MSANLCKDKSVTSFFYLHYFGSSTHRGRQLSPYLGYWGYFKSETCAFNAKSRFENFRLFDWPAATMSRLSKRARMIMMRVTLFQYYPGGSNHHFQRFPPTLHNKTGFWMHFAEPEHPSWFWNKKWKAGVRSESESKSESPGIVMTSKESESVHQIAPTKTPKRFVWIRDIICLCSMQGRACMHFLEIFCADIVFKFCSYAHIRITRGWGAMTFKGGSKGAKRGQVPKSARKCHEIDIFLYITRK